MLVGNDTTLTHQRGLECLTSEQWVMGGSDRGQQGAGSLARLRKEGAKDVNMDSNSNRIIARLEPERRPCQYHGMKAAIASPVWTRR